jgi:hypothetical protein
VSPLLLDSKTPGVALAIFLKPHGARAPNSGKTAPFTRSCDDEAVGISPPKRWTKFSLADLSTRADREHDGSTDVIDEILMRGNWPEEGGVR